MITSPFGTRRTSIGVTVGSVTIGGDAPIVVQSMTDTDTADVTGTAAQVEALARAGSELVRITVNIPEAAVAVAEIRQRLDDVGCSVPLIGDFHYNGHRLLIDYPDCAEALAKYRINPGNVGFGKKRDTQFSTMVETAIKYDKPIRIGVNWGSLDNDLLTRMMDDNAKLTAPRDAREVMREALIVSALSSAEKAEEIGLARDHIVLSCKVSGVQDLVGGVLGPGYPVRLCVTSGFDRGGHGLKRYRGLHRRHRYSAPAGSRRHHSRLTNPRTRCAPDQRSHRRPGNPPDHGSSFLHPLSYRLPGMRPYHQLFLPGARQQYPKPPPRTDATLARALSGCRGDVGGGHGLCGQWAW